MTTNTLFIEWRGMMIPDNEKPDFMDLNNYRYVTRIPDRNGRDLFVEFTRGACIRFTNKRTGEQLKKPVKEHDWKLWISTQYDNMLGSFGDCIMEKEVNKNNYLYCETDMLKAVNSIAAIEYESVIECDILPTMCGGYNYLSKEEKTRLVKHIEKLTNMSIETIKSGFGYRENDIFEYLATYKENQRDKTITLYKDNFVCCNSFTLSYAPGRVGKVTG